MDEMPYEHGTANPTTQQTRYWFSAERWVMLNCSHPQKPIGFHLLEQMAARRAIQPHRRTMSMSDDVSNVDANDLMKDDRPMTHPDRQREIMSQTNKPAEPPHPCEEVQRWSITHRGAERDPDGQWIHRSDFIALLHQHNSLNSENAQLRGEVEGLKQEVARLTEDADKASTRADELYETLHRFKATATDLTERVDSYRYCHDKYGDGKIETGRAWDKMRQSRERLVTDIGKVERILAKLTGEEPSSGGAG